MAEQDQDVPGGSPHLWVSGRMIEDKDALGNHNEEPASCIRTPKIRMTTRAIRKTPAS